MFGSFDVELVNKIYLRHGCLRYTEIKFIKIFNNKLKI